MKDTIHETRIDLERYVDEVRRELGDLPEEVREELTGDLGADLAELVDERGSGALPRPEQYAAELRASAGLPPAARRPLLAPDGWRPAWDVIVAAQPVWWVARAWVWVMLLHLVFLNSGADGYDVPWLPTRSFGLGLTLWVVASVVSIQIGRGRLWPGGAGRTAAAIAALAVLEVGTLAGAVLAVEQVDTVADTRSLDDREVAYDDVNPAVITYQQQQSCSLLVFDADGKRLRDVKIQDQSGRVLPQHNRDC
jgi:hypothetical protein